MARAMLLEDEAKDAELDLDTGIPKAELRQMLQAGLDELARGEGIVMDAAAWQALRTEMRQRHRSGS